MTDLQEMVRAADVETDEGREALFYVRVSDAEALLRQIRDLRKEVARLRDMRNELSERRLETVSMVRQLETELKEARKAARYCWEYFDGEEEEMEEAIYLWPWLEYAAEDAEERGGEKR